MDKTRITNIKTNIMNALLCDLKILKFFGGNGIKDEKAYMYKNIYPYLSTDHSNYHIDNYICFDVSESDGIYRMIFDIKSHVGTKQGDTYILDDLAELIQEDVEKVYPMCRKIHIEPSVCRGNFVEKRLSFSLYKYEMSATQ